MALQKIQANGAVDMLTKGEVAEVLASWQNELTRGARIRRLSMQGTTDGTGNLTIGGAGGGPAGPQQLGPDEGNVWGITRFSVAPGPTLAASGLQVYVNEIGQSQLLISKLVTDIFPDARGCMISSGDQLIINGTGITANAQVTVTMSMREVPALMAWSL